MKTMDDILENDEKGRDYKTENREKKKQIVTDYAKQYEEALAKFPSVAIIVVDYIVQYPDSHRSYGTFKLEDDETITIQDWNECHTKTIKKKLITHKEGTLVRIP